jgi:uncharacterized circularly permuted ATP-grasp superfamily protein
MEDFDANLSFLQDRLIFTHKVKNLRYDGLTLRTQKGLLVAVKTRRRSKDYNPNQGFIGHAQVDVANYLFSNRRRVAYVHTKTMVKDLLTRNVKDHHKESQKLTKFIRKRDLTFQKTTADGSYKIFTVPCTTTFVPLSKSMFSVIERAAQVLVVSLRAVIQDIYGSKSIQDSAFVKSLPKEARQIFIEAVTTSPNYFKQLHHPNMKKYPFFDNVGLDLVLVENYLSKAHEFTDLIKAGRFDKLPELPFKILELNAGSPSGASNNMNILEGVYEHNPQVLNGLGKIMPNDHFQVLAETYKSLGEEWTGLKDGVQVILPPGGLNGAAPEIHNLAAYSGLVYADPVQLFCDEKGYIRLRTINGSNPVVTAIYSRINADSALFNPDKDIILRDPDSGEPIYLRDSLKLGPDGKAPLVLDVDGNPIPLQSDYSIPGALEAIINKRMYMGGLNRILDNKIILATLTTYAPKFFEKRIRELGLDLTGPKIAPPETLAPKMESVKLIEKNPDEWVVKAPNLSGGTGVYILKTLASDKKAEVLSMIKKNPNHFAYQKLVKIARIPVAVQTKGQHRFANLAADIRLWVFYGGGTKALPRMTHNALVRFAPEERGPMSSIVNTSKGGGYAPFVVVDDTNHPHSVTASELIKAKKPIPLATHLPMFVAAQLIQVSRLCLEMHERLINHTADSYTLLGHALSLRQQCREILSFLNPRAIEHIYKMIDWLEARQAKKEIAAYFHFTRTQQIRLVKQLQILENDKKLPEQFREELDKLIILDDEAISSLYRDEDRKHDLKQLKIINALLDKKAKRSKTLVKPYKAVKTLLSSIIKAKLPNETFTGIKAKNLAKMIEDFMQVVKERLQDSEKAIEFAKLFSLDTKHPDLNFKTLYLKEELLTKKNGFMNATQREFATGQSLIESEFVSDELKAARQTWLKVLETAQSMDEKSRARYLSRKRKDHFTKFPMLARYQELMGKKSATMSELIELMPVMPYAHFNLTRFAEAQGCKLEEIFSRELTPNKISILSSKKIREAHLSAQEHAGECFAKKRKSHGLFSDSDIFIWIRKELDPMTQIYTAGHEIIHFHQIEETTQMEAKALSDGAIAQAYFLNFYGNFLGISTASLESLSVDVSLERHPLYGLADRIVPYFYTHIITEIRLAIQAGSEAYAAVLNKYGSLLSYMMPNSTQVRVKALQEVIPALENAKNIRFAKELGLDVAWDEIKSALPIANDIQVKTYASLIDRAIKSAAPDHEALRVIGNHQYYGVSFGAKVERKTNLTLKPSLSTISLGNSYNQTQQQQ